MVKNTLEPICNGKSPKEILNMRIADISCGSGVFLEEAYQFLVDYCVEWYSINDPKHLIELSNGKKKLPFAEKKNILCNCIYGVDIDIHAVEASKFSLLLKLIEDETAPSVKENKPILPDLDSNVRHGNALVSNKDLEKLNIETEELLKIVPFDWSMINDGQKFDVIIGNPPYVKTEDIKKLHCAHEISVYRQFASAYRQYDKYYLFIEKAMELINEKGIVCYIVPNKFMHTESAEKIRMLMRDKIAKLDDFGAAQLFEDKTIYSSIITLNGEKAENLMFRNVENAAQLWSDTSKQFFSVNKVNLNAMPWFLCGDKDYADMLADLAGKIVPLSDIVEIYNGIQTSAEKIYKIDGKTILCDDDLYVRFELSGKEYLIEKGILKPYFKPTHKEQGSIDTYSDIGQIQINYNIFPYDQNGEFITKDIMEKDYPYAWKYLLEHKEKLMPKSLGGRRDVQPEVSSEDEWYRYGRSQAITSLNNRQKIIVGVNRSKGNPLYLLDSNNYLIASGGTAGYVGISLLPNSQYELEYIHAWLSHPWTDLYLQVIGSDFEGGFIARGTYTLPMVPFVEIDFSDERQQALYHEVVTATQKVFSINKKMLGHADKATESVLQKEKDRLIRKIRDLITKVYQQNF